MNKIFNSFRYKNPFYINDIDELRVEMILKLMGKRKKVLDLGCGDGFIMERINTAGNFAEGVEISTNAVKSARKKGFVVYDYSLDENWANKIKSKYDVVFLGETIEHVFDTDKLLQNVKKVLKKNGHLIITTPNIAALGRRLLLLLGMDPLVEITARSYDAGHIRYFTFDTLTRLLIENSFEVEHISSTHISFNGSGKFYSTKLAKLFPKLGSTIIVKAKLK